MLSVAGDHESVSDVSVIEVMADKPEKVGGVVSVDTMTMVRVTSVPFKSAYVSPLYKTLEDESSASTEKCLLDPFETSNDSVMVVLPETEIVFSIVAISVAEIVNFMEAIFEGIVDEAFLSPLLMGEAVFVCPIFILTVVLPEAVLDELPPPPPQDAKRVMVKRLMIIK